MTEQEYIHVYAYATMQNIKALMVGTLLPEGIDKAKFQQAAKLVSKLCDDLYRKGFNIQDDYPEADADKDDLDS